VVGALGAGDGENKPSIFLNPDGPGFCSRAFGSPVSIPNSYTTSKAPSSKMRPFGVNATLCAVLSGTGMKNDCQSPVSGSRRSRRMTRFPHRSLARTAMLLPSGDAASALGSRSMRV
jgi:hypothetical protein